MRSDPRINRKGRPRSFDELRKLAQAIANETTTDTQGNKITTADALLRSWARSKQPILQKAFIEYAFGKVPDKLEMESARQENDAHPVLRPRTTRATARSRWPATCRNSVSLRAIERVYRSSIFHLAVGHSCRCAPTGGELPLPTDELTPRPMCRAIQCRALMAPICRGPRAQESAVIGETPPETSTLPLRSNVACMTGRAGLRGAVSVQVPLAGSYSSAVAIAWPGDPPKPPATSTCPSGSKVAVCQKPAATTAAGHRPDPSRRIV